jgi:folylpolyglutamate synthase
VFFSKQVDVAIFETNSGGTYNATNIVKPNVVGITRLGIDHVSTLGSTIDSIASHKSGIIKPYIPAFSSLQVPAATTVLKKRATEKFAQLTFVDTDDRLPADAFKPTVQRENASLALALASTFLQKTISPEDCEITPQDISCGIELFSWPGRFQQIVNGNC